MVTLKQRFSISTETFDDQSLYKYGNFTDVWPPIVLTWALACRFAVGRFQWTVVGACQKKTERHCDKSAQGHPCSPVALRR